MSRRYIADFVSKRERTKASAAFVGSSAMGMALGPLLARLFQSFPTMHLGPLTFNYITMGACAAGLWGPLHLQMSDRPAVCLQQRWQPQCRKQGPRFRSAMAIYPHMDTFMLLGRQWLDPWC